MRALEIGPGRNPVDKSWTIVDMVKRPWVDVIHDVRELPLPFEDNSFDLVYLSHILEHIPQATLKQLQLETPLTYFDLIFMLTLIKAPAPISHTMVMEIQI